MGVNATRVVDVSPPPAAMPPRMPLRSQAFLALIGVIVPALLLGAGAWLFRGSVRAQLDAIARDLPKSPVGAGLAEQLMQVQQSVDGGLITLACLAWLGISSLAVLAWLFVARLARDIRAVRGRALAIVTGERGRAPPMARNDELGDLAQAVDDLALALERREQALNIERRQAVHQETLAAIGGMAAGVLREICNPIAAIDGYARALIDARNGSEAAPAPAVWCDPGLILNETARLVAITREISGLMVAPATQRQLVSVNEVVTQSLALLRFERRLDGVALQARLDPQLPATEAVADRLVLLVMSLVVNAADAVAGMPARTARIEVATDRGEGGIVLVVSDNGCGMSADVIRRAFEPGFTTKPPGVGTGLGLPLCRAIARDHGGSVELASAPGAGARATVHLPLPVQ